MQIGNMIVRLLKRLGYAFDRGVAREKADFEFGAEEEQEQEQEKE